MARSWGFLKLQKKNERLDSRNLSGLTILIFTYMHYSNRINVKSYFIITFGRIAFLKTKED